MSKPIKEEGPNDADNQGIWNRLSYGPKIMNIGPKDCDRFICILCTAHQAKKKTREGNEEEQENVCWKVSWLQKHLATNSYRSFTPRD